MPEPIERAFRQAYYLTSAHRLDQLPADHGREVAFAGRSNAGKSSAINAICGQRALARSSKTPGRTQQIVLFALNDAHRLVDLPGFGYARVPERLRAHWRRTLDAYLRSRRSLAGLILIMDARHPMKEFDREMLAWCVDTDLPCHLLLTKADKLKRGAQAQALQSVRGFLDTPLLSAQLFSSQSGLGVEEARSVISAWFNRAR